MQKIPTIFKRDFTNGGSISGEYVIDPTSLTEWVATEKLDGTNVRLTVRNHTLIRLEKRRNPDKIQKQKGIEEPWYVDADEYSPEDKYIWEAARNTDLSIVEDGEWSGEALGPDIQGNPLNLDEHTVFLFSVPEIRNQFVFKDCPIGFEELKAWLPLQKSRFGKDCGIEGIVWHSVHGDMAKIKTKDFR